MGNRTLFTKEQERNKRIDEQNKKIFHWLITVSLSMATAIFVTLAATGKI